MLPRMALATRGGDLGIYLVERPVMIEHLGISRPLLLYQLPRTIGASAFSRALTTMFLRYYLVQRFIGRHAIDPTQIGSRATTNGERNALILHALIDENAYRSGQSQTKIVKYLFRLTLTLGVNSCCDRFCHHLLHIVF